MSRQLKAFVALAVIVIAGALVLKFSFSDVNESPIVSAGTCGLSGMVASANGQAVSGATVCAIPFSMASGTATCAQSNSDGSYQLEKLAAQDYRVSASAADVGSGAYQDSVRLQECGVRSQIDIVLALQGAELAGRVHDGSGNPIKDAHVKVVGQGAAFKFGVAVQSNRDGAFTAIVPSGPMKLEVTARGYAKAQASAVAPNSHLDIVLIPGATLSGQVVSKADGRPVVGINVRAVPDGMITHEYAPSAPSDQNGQFSIEALPPGIYRLEAVDKHWRGRNERVIDLSLGDRIENLLVEVVGGVQVKGRVLASESHTPCKLGNVALFANSPEDEKNREDMQKAQREPDPKKRRELMNALRGKSGGAFYGSLIATNGEVLFDGVPPGRYGVGVSCIDHRPQGTRAPNIEIADEDVAGVEWLVDPASRITISVADEAGRPVDNVNVGVRNERNAFMPAFGQGKGKYTLSPVPPGNYRAIAANRSLVSADSSGNQKDSGVPVVIGEDAQSLEVSLILRGSGQIEVHVLANDGSPRGGLHVYAMPPDAPTPMAMVTATELGNGLYRIEPLGGGNYRVLVGDGQNPALEQEVTLGVGETRKLELQLQTKGRIDGRVVDGNGKPIPGVVVAARSENGTGVYFRPPTMGNDQLRDGAVMTDASGNFSIAGLAEDSHYEVVAQKAMSILSKQSGVAPGSHLSLVMESTRLVSGVAVDDSGRPVDGFSVAFFNKDAGIGRSGMQTSMGEWRLDGVMPGRIVVSAQDAKGREAEQEVVVEPGRDVSNVRLVLRSNTTDRETAVH